MDADLGKLREILQAHYSYSELLQLSFDLGIDFDALGGEDKSSKARELIIFAERRGLLDLLVKEIRRTRPGLNLSLASNRRTTDPASDIEALSIELASLRQQLNEIQRDPFSPEQVEERVNEMLRTANRAIGRSEELTARVLLPPSELTDVQLLPSGMLDRLEEYRSDENVMYLLIGGFTGAVLGILSNWATSDPFVITKFSIVLLILFLILTVVSIFWTWRIKQRVARIKERIFTVNPLQEAQIVSGETN